MGVVTAIAAGVGALAAAGSAIAGASAANKQRRAAQRNKSKAEREIESLKKSRQTIINPFAGVTDLSSMASDLSGQISNPFASLGVATSAAEIQIEEADIALANTLDTLRATGASAGGATALAQGALRSKRGISANIQQQEAQNAMFRAQGEQSSMAMRISEARRMQAMNAQGKQYMFETQENRDMAQLDRTAGMQTQYATQANALQMQSNQIMGQAIPNALSAGANLYMASQAGS